MEDRKSGVLGCCATTMQSGERGFAASGVAPGTMEKTCYGTHSAFLQLLVISPREKLLDFVFSVRLKVHSELCKNQQRDSAGLRSRVTQFGMNLDVSRELYTHAHKHLRGS